MKIILISCVKRKLTYRCRARDLYISSFFKKNLQYAMTIEHDHIFILSAKYHLLDLDEEIDPYDETLNKMPALKLKCWAARVVHQLSERANLKQDQFVLLAGAQLNIRNT